MVLRWIITAINSKRALITGITGQDGSYLAEFLLGRGYEVFGFGRKASIENSKILQPYKDKILFKYGDLSDGIAVVNALESTKPSEIYNLGAMSMPGRSWQHAIETGNVTALGALRLLDAVKDHCRDARIFHASSSEMYGDVLETPQTEVTAYNPVNPYAASKVFAHQLAKIYRNTYNMFIACGTMFNHESPRRGLGFITQKVAYGAACAKLGIRCSEAKNEHGEPIVSDNLLSLGSLDASRDWGYAPDYVRAMWLMLQQEEPDDFVVGTGISRSIKDLCHTAYSHVGKNWQDHVVTDIRFVRPVETLATVANPTKAIENLGWRPSISFEEMIGNMVDSHLAYLSNK